MYDWIGLDQGVVPVATASTPPKWMIGLEWVPWRCRLGEFCFRVYDMPPEWMIGLEWNKWWC